MSAVTSSLILTIASLWEAPCATPASVRSDRELLVTSEVVIADERAAPGGPWHFASLVRELLPAGATDAEVSDAVLGWLASYGQDQTLTPDPARPASSDNPARYLPKRAGPWAEIAVPWLGASGGQTLDLAKAPFKLLAIVNRMDVRDPAQCQSAAGEGRFVFVALDGFGEPLNFTIIFEYDLPTTTRDARGWADAWHALSALPCDDAASCTGYLETLESVTRAFSTRAGGAQLAQLRTNDVLTFPGELREFGLSADGRITPKALNMTPDLAHVTDAALGAWILENRDAVMAERFTLPGRFVGFSGLYPRLKKWQFANVEDEELRFHFSKSTCNGCHTFEHPRVRGIDGAYHVSPRGEVSEYLTVEELPRRQEVACATLNLLRCDDARLERRHEVKAKIRTH